MNDENGGSRSQLDHRNALPTVVRSDSMDAAAADAGADAAVTSSSDHDEDACRKSKGTEDDENSQHNEDEADDHDDHDEHEDERQRRSVQSRGSATTTTCIFRDSLTMLRKKDMHFTVDDCDGDGDGDDSSKSLTETETETETENLTESFSSLDPIIPRVAKPPAQVEAIQSSSSCTFHASASTWADRAVKLRQRSTSSVSFGSATSISTAPPTCVMESTSAATACKAKATYSSSTSSTASFLDQINDTAAATDKKKRRILETASLLLDQNASSGRRRSVTAGRIIRGIVPSRMQLWTSRPSSDNSDPPRPTPSSSSNICGSAINSEEFMAEPTTTITTITTITLPDAHHHHHQHHQHHHPSSSSSPSHPHLRSSLRKTSTSPALKMNRNTKSSNTTSNNKNVSFSERLVDYLGGSRNSILNNASLSSLNTSISLFEDVFDATGCTANFSNSNMNNNMNINFNNSGSSLSSSMTMTTTMPLSSSSVSSSSTSFATAAAARASRRGSGGNSSLYLNESFQMSLDCLDEMQTFKEEQEQGSSSSLLSWANEDSSFSCALLRPIDEHSFSSNMSTSSAATSTSTKAAVEDDKKTNVNRSAVSDCLVMREEHEKHSSNAYVGVAAAGNEDTADNVRNVVNGSSLSTISPHMEDKQPPPPPRIITPPARRQHKHRRVHTFDETMSYQRLRSVVLYCRDGINKQTTSAKATTATTAVADIDPTNAMSRAARNGSNIQKTCSDDLWIMVHFNHNHPHYDVTATTPTTSNTTASSTTFSFAGGKKTTSRCCDSLESTEKKPPRVLEATSNDLSFGCYEKEQTEDATVIDICFHSWLSLVLQDDDEDDANIDDNDDDNQVS